MNTTQIKITDKVSITIAALSQGLIARAFIAGSESDIKMPEPPEGYTREQAEENLESFKKEMDDYQASISTRRILCSIGMARNLAVDSGAVTEEEVNAIAVLCKRYLHPGIENDDPYIVGQNIYSLLVEFGLPTDLLEADFWLQKEAGLIDANRVAEIIKSLRSARERFANTGSISESETQEKSARKEGDNVKPTDGGGRRSAKVGRNAAKHIRRT